MTRNEQRVLSALLAAGGKFVPAPDLYKSVWPIFRPDQPENNVKVYVSRLRKKIAPHGLAIFNDYRGGYCIRDVASP